MATKTIPTPEQLRQRIHLDPTTGALVWKYNPLKHKRWNSRWVGQPALSAPTGHGYLRGNIDGASIYAHRAVFAIYHGRWPDGEVDHIDGDTTNNKPCNLREATKSENQLNSKSRSTSTSQYRGVCWDSRRGKWLVQAKLSGRGKCIGHFSDEEDAAIAFDAYAMEHLGPFARLNFP